MLYPGFHDFFIPDGNLIFCLLPFPKQRTKEIGISKVLGASIGQAWLLLSKDFILLVLISCVIVSTVALIFSVIG
jgi:predicted lysophospholipase L1 biosynthesis ABC-type transport system permease subunit